MKLIGVLCVVGAVISLMFGLVSGHFAPHRPWSHHRRNDLVEFLQEIGPGFIPSAVIAVSLLTLGFVILMIRGR